MCAEGRVHTEAEQRSSPTPALLASPSKEADCSSGSQLHLSMRTT